MKVLKHGASPLAIGLGKRGPQLIALFDCLGLTLLRGQAIPDECLYAIR